MPIRFRFAIASFLVALAVAGCDGNSPPPRSISSYLDSAEAYIDQGQYRAAVIELDNAALIDSSNIRLHVLQAQINIDLGNFRSAWQALENVRPEEKSLAYIEALAEAYLRSGKYASTLLLVRQNSSVFAENRLAEALLKGRSFVGLEELDTAREHFDAALGIDPESIDAKLGFVSILAARGDLIRAEERLTRLLESHPENVQSLLLLSAIHLAQGRMERAEESLTETIGVLPSTDLYTFERANVLRTLIALLARLGRSGEALVYQQALESAFPEAQQNNAMYQQALSSLQAGDYETAEMLLAQLYERSPGHQTGGALLGILSFLEGDDEEARRYFEESVDEETATVPILKAVAMNLYRLDQPERVVDTLQPRIATTRDPEILAIYGVASIAAGEVEQGESALRRAIDLNPDSIRLRILLAQHFNQLEPAKQEAALETLEQGREIQPESALLLTAVLDQLLMMGQEAKGRELVASIVNDSSGYDLVTTGAAFWLRLGEFERAEALYQKAIGIDREPPLAWYGLAELRRQAGNHEGAREAVREIIERNPSNRIALTALLDIWNDEGKLAQGIQELEELATDSPIPTLTISRYLTRRNRLEDAERFVAQISQDSPSYTAARRLSAEIGLRRAREAASAGEHEKARENLFRSLGIFPLNRELLRALGKVELDAGQIGEAEKVLQTVRANHPDSWLVEELEADIALARGEYQKAAANYQNLWQKLPDDGVAARLVTALRRSQRESDALDFVADWRNTRPSSALAAVVAAELHPEQDAIGILETYLADHGDRTPILNNLAWLYLEESAPERGLEVAQRAYRLAPGNGAVLDTYGWMLFQNGEVEEAVEVMERAHKLEPESAEISRHLEVVRAAL